MGARLWRNCDGGLEAPSFASLAPSFPSLSAMSLPLASGLSVCDWWALIHLMSVVTFRESDGYGVCFFTGVWRGNTDLSLFEVLNTSLLSQNIIVCSSWGKTRIACSSSIRKMLFRKPGGVPALSYRKVWTIGTVSCLVWIAEEWAVGENFQWVVSGCDCTERGELLSFRFLVICEIW